MLTRVVRHLTKSGSVWVLPAAMATGAVFAPSAAHATVISRVFSITANSFTASNGAAIPSTSVAAVISVIWDNALTYTNQTTGISVISATNLPFTAPIQFNYTTANSGTLTIGGSPNAGTASPGSDDFVVSFQNITSSLTPLSPTLLYTRAGTGLTAGATFTSSNVSVTAAAPEPGSLALMALPLLGFVMFRRNRSSAAAIAA